jgi:hypothetical protein
MIFDGSYRALHRRLECIAVYLAVVTAHVKIKECGDSE